MQTEIQSLLLQIVENEKNADEAEKKKAWFETLYEAVKNADELYLAYNEQTGYPYIDGDGSVWMFSAKEYADLAEDYYRQQLVLLTTRRVEKEKIMGTFAQLYTWGMEQVRLDNGQCTAVIERGRILPPPDWSHTPKEQIPVMNPILQRRMITFFQELRSRADYPGKKEAIHKLEAEMLEEVLKGTYIVPMQRQAQNMVFANLGDERDRTDWLPAFTDWNEFEIIYDKKQWNGCVMTYDDLCTVSGARGIVVNPAGVNFRISQSNKQAIAQFRQEKLQKPEPETSQVSASQKPEPEMPQVSASQEPVPETPQEVPQVSVPQEPVSVQRQVAVENVPQQQGHMEEAPAEFEEKLDAGAAKVIPMTQYPAQLINAAQRCMNYMPEVRRAYAVQILEHDQPCYLIVVDFLGDRNRVFGELKRNLPPMINGVRVILHEADSVGLELTKHVKPFFKRGLFG